MLTVYESVANPSAIEFVQRVLHGEDLDGGKRAVDMRIVSRKRAKAGGIVVPAAKYKVDERLAIEHVGSAQDLERGEAPVDAVHTQVRGEMVGERVALLVERLDKRHMQRDEQLPGHCMRQTGR